MPENPIKLNQKSIIPILLSHLNRYPLMSVQDIYKLIHQAAMGPGHLIPDKGSAFERLCHEFEQIEILFSQPLLEEIDPLGQLVRLNLSPFKKQNGDLKKLFEVFYQTSITFKTIPLNMKQYCDEIISMLSKHKSTYDSHDQKSYFQIKESQNFPAVHHSAKYRNTYHPAYRLIAKKLLHELQ
jgi:hypothetical protein